MTGDARAADKAKEIGASAYLRKPMNIDTLEATVARFFGPERGAYS